MDILIQALIVISVPFDLAIMLGGAYMIRAYSMEQALIREAAHDAEITNRENIRLQQALAKNGQYEGNSAGGLDIGQLITQFAPALLAKQGQQQPAGSTEDLKNVSKI